MTNSDMRHWDNLGVEVLDSGAIADTAPPSVGITSPAPGAWVHGTVPVGISAADNVGVTRTEVYVDNVLLSTANTSGLTASWDTKTVADGYHAITAKAYDAAGNVGNSGTLAVTVDNTPPAVTLTGAAAGATLTGTAALSATAKDAGGVTATEIYVDGVLAASSATGSTTFSWDTTKVADGAHTLQAKSYDTAGNAGTSDLRSVTVKNQKAKNPGPTCTFAWPTNGLTVPGWFIVFVKASSDATKVNITIDGKYSFDCTSVPFFCMVTPSTPLAVGSHTIVATAYNNAGTAGAPAKITVTLK
jgi:hypothetical protein